MWGVGHGLSSVLRECSQPGSCRVGGAYLHRFPATAGSVRRDRHVRTAPVPLENCIASTSIFELPSYKEPTVDALASTTDEGRGWLRKATGSCLTSFDPWISEWGNPAPFIGCHFGLNT
jgi:hypothetical protein